MPTYAYRCANCGDTETWQSIHAAPLAMCACGAPLVRILGPVRTVGVGARGEKTRTVNETERTWDKDRPAYQRLRHAGMQPPHVDGCDKLEAVAKNEFEVNTGYRYGPMPEQRVREGIGLAQESGWIPRKAS